ncbi:SRPBCC family protein [[Mycobacterium] vasticus]|uniref:SRPBCC family protein n=1 Tax=[Mycobacterium] vasticus TaxID=2875777 RepID=A0ABU5Z2X4_9MYCO|nr:SRPBCC family protein [Mycolicibacter sp. MYC017]MEB3071718.1 SRPBCC family protein [Mycolicibacter sp. MYC017]
MELSNTFTVNLPVEEAWKVFTDLERVAPCLPGAALLGVDGDVYRGMVKIKVGPVTAQYQGTARFVEKDDQAFRAVIRAEGKDVGGQGNAAATVTAVLGEQGAGTKVTLKTDLSLSGRVAQFGRGVIADVTSKLINQFVDRLEAEVGSGDAAVSGGASRQVSVDDIEPIDVMSNMGGLIARRAAPVLGALLAAGLGILLMRLRIRVPRQPDTSHPSIVINLVLPAALTDAISRS